MPLPEEEFRQITDKYIKQLAADKGISKCEAASIMLQGLLFIDDLPHLKNSRLFHEIETEVIASLYDYTCEVCTAGE